MVLLVDANKAIKKTTKTMTWRPTVEEFKLIAELKGRLGVSESDIVRIGIRRLAQAEGVIRK